MTPSAPRGRDAAALVRPLIVPLSLFLCAVGAGLLPAPAHAETAGADAPPAVSALVQVTPVRHTRMARHVNGYGAVDASPSDTLDLNVAHAAQVADVRVHAWQVAQKGQPLVDLVPDPSARLAFLQAANAEAFAQRELARLQGLLAQQLATRSQVDAAARALKDARQALSSQAALGTGAARVTLRAPFDGLVTAVSSAPGDRVAAGATVVQLARTDHLQAQIGLEPADVGGIGPGMTVRIASVFDTTHAVDGTVTAIGGRIDPQSLLLPVTVRLGGKGLLPGSRVHADFAVDAHVAQAVPRSAVLNDRLGSYLFQVVGGHAHRVTVQTGVEDDGWVEIKSPALADAPVVRLGNYELEDGMAVREGAQ